MCECVQTQLCLTLCNPTDCSPPGSSVYGILQAKILEWVAISFSRRSSQPGTEPISPALQADFWLLRHPGSPHCFMLLLLQLLLSHISRVLLCVTPQTAAHQAPPSLGFSRQEHWKGLPFPSPTHESEKWKVKSLSHVQLLATPWTAAYQAPPSMWFSRQEYWSGVPLPSPLLYVTGYRRIDLFWLLLKQETSVEIKGDDNCIIIAPGSPHLKHSAVGTRCNKQLWKLEFVQLLLLSHFSRVRLCVTP